MINQEILYFFKRNPIFESLNLRDKKILELLSKIQIQEFPKYTILYEKDQPANHVHILLSGEVGIFSVKGKFDIQNLSSHSENQRLISIHRKGSIFGEVSFLSGETHSSTAITLTKSKIGFIPGGTFLELLNKDIHVTMKIIKLLSSRFRQKIGEEPNLHIGKVFACLYPEYPNRIIPLIKNISYISKKEIQEPIAVLYFQTGYEKDEENQRNFEFFFKNFENDDFLESLESKLSKEKAIFLNALKILKEKELETKIIDFLSILKKIFTLVFIEIPSFDYWISHTLLKNSDQILFFQRFGTTGLAIKDLYIEQMTNQNLINKDKVIYIYEKSSKEKGYREKKEEQIFYLNTFIAENSEPQENKSFRRFVRMIIGNSRGLVLGGGGARAFAHIGVLEIFDSEQIEFDAVIGSSMGAIIGALYCMGYEPIQIRKKIETYLCKSELILDKTIPTVAFFKGKKVNLLLDQVFEDIRIEDLDIPFYCTSTDLVTGKLVIFESGFLDFALRCTVSLPGIFPPIQYGEFVLVDGSVVNNLPGEFLKGKNYNKILGINVTPLMDPLSSQLEMNRRMGFKGIYKYYSLPPILNIINRSIAIQGRELLKYQMQYFNYILHPDVSQFGLFDFHLYDEIIAKGREKAIEKLQEIKEIFVE
ncbi:MAG: patatin-like phospholipase family protein [Leptonema sp. (in: bacteria)]